jgi:CRISPR-associated protein Csx10
MDLPKNVALPFCHIRHRRGEPGDEEEAGPARPASDVGLYSPPMQVTVHIALENPNVRGEENKLYRYDALAEGQAFAGAIISQDGKGLGELKTLLEGGDLFLGRAHTAGYGRVAVEADEPRDWPEYDPGDNPPKGRLIVTLLSDTILRHANGQVGASAEETLGSVLGLSGKCRKFERLLPAGGFNRKWGLPLAQSWAMHAGSVYVWEAPRADVSALRRAVEMGIGERRAEGFGRVAVNWHTAPALTRFKLEASQPTQAVQLSPRSREQARSMARRQLRRVLEGKLVEKVNQLSIRDAPENAQLSRIRVCALHSQHDNSTQPILEYLKGLRERDAIHQFRRCRIAGVPLDAWIEERAKELDVQQQLLGAGKPPQVAGEEATLTDELRVEYTARLIDAVMKKAIQERRAPQGKPGAGRRPKEGR